MTQTRWMSFIEAITNVAVGFLVSLISQLWIFAAYGIHLALSDNLMITVWFTVVSIARSYALRRYFNSRRVPA